MLIHTRRTPTRGQSQRRTFIARANCYSRKTDSCPPHKVEKGELTGANELTGTHEAAGLIPGRRTAPEYHAIMDQPEVNKREEGRHPEGGPR